MSIDLESIELFKQKAEKLNSLEFVDLDCEDVFAGLKNYQIAMEVQNTKDVIKQFLKIVDKFKMKYNYTILPAKNNDSFVVGIQLSHEYLTAGYKATSEAEAIHGACTKAVEMLTVLSQN